MIYLSGDNMIKNKNELYQSKNYRRLIELNGFLKVPFCLAMHYDINPTEALILAYIDNATKHLEEKAFTGSETTLQALCNSSKSTVRRSLKSLKEKGLIERLVRRFPGGKERIIYRSLKAIQLKINIENT